MARQEVLEPLHRPFLERFRQQRVVRVSERALRESPGVGPAQFRLVQQQPHQFRHRDGGMRVVELNGGLVGQRGPIIACGAEATDEVGQRAGDEKVFLEKSQTFAFRRVIVGIQHAREGFSGERFGQCADEIAIAELGEVEGVGCSWQPTDAAC